MAIIAVALGIAFMCFLLFVVGMAALINTDLEKQKNRRRLARPIIPKVNYQCKPSSSYRIAVLQKKYSDDDDSSRRRNDSIMNDLALSGAVFGASYDDHSSSSCHDSSSDHCSSSYDSGDCSCSVD